MAAIFNGSNSGVLLTQSAAAPSYPIIVTCHFQAANTSHNGTLISLSDNGSGGSPDALSIAARGDQTGDKVYATATAAGSASDAITGNGFIADTWYVAVGVFNGTTSRFAVVTTGSAAPTWSTESTTSRSVGNLTHISIGALYNSGATNFFNGQLAHAAVFYGVESDHIDVAVRQLCSGLPGGSERLIIHSALAYYQPLLNAANQSGSVGGTATASNLTFNGVRPGGNHFMSLRTPHSQPGGASSGFRWPFTGSTPGPLPDNRLVILSDGALELADGSDANGIGATVPWEATANYMTAQQPVRSLMNTVVEVEVANGATIEEGDEVYQAAGGKISDTGTIRVGAAYEGGEAGDVIRVLRN